MPRRSWWVAPPSCGPDTTSSPAAATTSRSAWRTRPAHARASGRATSNGRGWTRWTSPPAPSAWSPRRAAPRATSRAAAPRDGYGRRRSCRSRPRPRRSSGPRWPPPGAGATAEGPAVTWGHAARNRAQAHRPEQEGAARLLDPRHLRGRPRADRHRGEEPACRPRLARRRVRLDRRRRGVAPARAHPRVRAGHVDQPRPAPEAHGAHAPSRNRQAERQDQGGRAHARPAGPVLQGRQGQGDARAGEGQKGVRQATGPRRTRLPPRDPEGVRPLCEGSPVRAAVYDRFGDESVLRIVDDHPEPPVGPDVVLVRAHAAGVNPVDIGIREGYLAGAYPHHFPITPGWDLAGVVERVGPAVVDFAPGDEVFGYVRRDDVQWGTAADLVPVPQRCLAHKPDSLSFAEAGLLPPAGRPARPS